MSDFPSTTLLNGFRQFSVAGRTLPLVGATVGDSTTTDLARLDETVWKPALDVAANTVFAPVPWQLLEPREGEFDFAIPDALFEGARKNGLKLAVIWFGSWKNGTSCYAPDWVKLDWNRFPLAHPQLGRRTELLSPCSQELLAAETAAFTALAGRLRDLEKKAGGERTVALVQVEEGIGMIGGSRDVAGDSDKRWGAGVPAELVAALADRSRRLHPEIAKAVGRSGSWTEVFGPNAESAFMAWQFAKHVATLAREAGKILSVPFFVSAWNVDDAIRRVGDKPGGAPDGDMADIWDVAAPDVFRSRQDPPAQSLRFLHPSVGDNAKPALFPRIEPGPDYPAKALFLFGRVLACGVSATRVDGCDSPGGNQFAPLVAQANAAIRFLRETLGQTRSEDSARAFYQFAAAAENFTLGDFSFAVKWTGQARKQEAPGGIVVMLDREGAFWVAGVGAQLLPKDDRKGFVTSILREDEWLFAPGGGFVRGRVLNGDDRDMVLPAGKVSIRKFTLYRRPV